ncbi:NlpC/P60 family protein [Geodermatophilus sp. YIM 151500]|uniref:C40 family peptidase n=1 Tax=Geodermatophilus sp. YIM 151500 TaxID=2984531 RepID=UPI0021E48598|nr:NlpC/P60 family protein [Geodermatophilus sp. YIM 151500]MCV2490169.1 NlpC/P60 family protein [Geodermatophilus sp. YIM 151500]
MATPRALVRSTPRRHLARRIAIAVTGVVGVLVASLPAHATPVEKPETSAEAAQLVAARGHELEVVAEEFNEAREVMKAQQEAAVVAAAELERAEAALADAQEAVRGVARSAYTGEGLGSFQALLTSESADEFVDRVATLQTIAGHQNGVLDEAASAGVTAARARADAEKAATDAQVQFDAVAAEQAALERQVAEYQALYEELSAAERQAALEAAAAAHAAETAAGRAPEPQRASRGERSAPVPPAPVAAGGPAAAQAVATAMAQRGKPYVWAAAGPGSFDCSGLVQYAYAAAGVTLPHSSKMQAGMGRSVSRGELQPGDLVAFYSPVSHIGIYIGNGQMVHAPTSGDVVKVAPLDYMGKITAMRRIA